MRRRRSPIDLTYPPPRVSCALETQNARLKIPTIIELYILQSGEHNTIAQYYIGHKKMLGENEILDVQECKQRA